MEHKMKDICKCCGQTIKKDRKETVNAAEILIPVSKLWVNGKRRPVGIFIKSSDLRLNLMVNKGNPLIVDRKLKSEIADLGGVSSMVANDRGYYSQDIHQLMSSNALCKKGTRPRSLISDTNYTNFACGLCNFPRGEPIFRTSSQCF
jgi:hypothetical protein